MAMKNLLYIFSILLVLFINACKEDTIKESAPCVLETTDSSVYHPKAHIYKNLIEEYVKKGLPGITLLIHDDNGTWIGSAGKADIENDVDMNICTVSKVASITKMYMATLILMLYDEGKLALDDKINKYIDKDICDKINNGNEATIRQILNHTSGIYDIISDQGLYLKLLNNPNRDWTADELLEFAYKKDAYFPVGEGVHYSNTNFLLVSLIIEKITGKPHVNMLKERIFVPLELNDSYYHWDDELPATTAQGYYDLHNNGTILNLSNYHTGSGNGYNGIYCTVGDLEKFIRALLVEKTLISDSALYQMQQFTEVEEGTNRRLGLGIYKDFQDRSETDYALGHRGRDLQYSADLFWFPKTSTSMAFLINYGMNGESSLSDIFYEFREKLADEILK